MPIYLGSARSTSLDYVTINPGFKGGQYAAHNTKQKLYTEEPRSDCPCESLEGITKPLSFWYSYKQTVSTYTRCFFCSKSPESGAVLAQSAISRAQEQREAKLGAVRLRRIAHAISKSTTKKGRRYDYDLWKIYQCACVYNKE